MKISLSFCALLAFVQLCAATPFTKRWDDLAVHHAWAEVPRGWELVGPASADHTLNLRISLKENRADELVKRVLETSDPSHASYGKHLSKDELKEFVAPHADSVEIVDAWLAHHEIDTKSEVKRSVSGQTLSLKLPVGRAEKLLGTTYSVYKRIGTGETVVRTLDYSLPRALLDHVTVVTPTTYFSSIKPADAPQLVKRMPEPLAPLKRDSTCDFISPACVAQRYNTTSYVPQAADKGNSLAVIGFHNDGARHSDLAGFFKYYAPDATGSTFTDVSVNGGANSEQQATMEGTTAIQYSLALTHPTPVIYQSVGGNGGFIPDVNTPTDNSEPYDQWLDYVLGLDAVPNTISISYSEDEQTVPKNYADQICAKFLQLGALGSSVVVSSGATGVGGLNANDEGLCLKNDGSNETAFLPTFPASCPWVTSVGMTRISPSKGPDGPEEAQFTSGGGFSIYNAAPDYQKDVVAAYVNGLGSDLDGKYNPQGRGIPDVAAFGYGLYINWFDMPSEVSDTGAAVFAAIASLLNDYRLANGKPSLGFLNPWLYSDAAPGLHDITAQANYGCGGKAFDAAKGWDAVTGLGSPNFGLLKETV